MDYYLLHHHKRAKVLLGLWRYVYYENFPWTNMCPYIFSKEFIHTFCRAFPLRKEIGNVNFWIHAEWGENQNQIKSISCDLVFVVWRMVVWKDANSLRWHDAKEALWYADSSSHQYKNHFSWHGQHYLKKRRRTSLFADADRSFQPIDSNGGLVDIKPFFESLDANSRTSIYKSLKPVRGIGVRNLKLDEAIWKRLQEYIESWATMKIRGRDLQHLDPRKLDMGNPVIGACFRQ